MILTLCNITQRYDLNINKCSIWITMKEYNMFTINLILLIPKLNVSSVFDYLIIINAHK